MDDERYMGIALEEARAAFHAGEIPVGAVIVKDGDLLTRKCNANRSTGVPTKHAEILAIEEAASLIRNERLIGCTLYVTKEPCAMCAGAIIHARIERLVIGTRDYRFGACGTVFSVCGNPAMNHVPLIVFGVMESPSAEILKEFFKLRRIP